MSAVGLPGRQQSLTDALEAAAAGEGEATVQDDRVVTDGLACECGRPAGADGLCTSCRMDQNGDLIAGRRL